MRSSIGSESTLLDRKLVALYVTVETGQFTHSGHPRRCNDRLYCSTTGVPSLAQPVRHHITASRVHIDPQSSPVGVHLKKSSCRFVEMVNAEKGSRKDGEGLAAKDMRYLSVSAIRL